MSRIQFSELHPAGSELFYDAETFLSELTEQEMSAIMGGVEISQVTVTAGYRTTDAGNLNVARGNAFYGGDTGGTEMAQFRRSLSFFQDVLNQYSIVGF